MSVCLSVCLSLHSILIVWPSALPACLDSGLPPDSFTHVVAAYPRPLCLLAKLHGRVVASELQCGSRAGLQQRVCSSKVAKSGMQAEGVNGRDQTPEPRKSRIPRYA
jgi:hypothetical protein